jgi:YD repeat-containing protein
LISTTGADGQNIGLNHDLADHTDTVTDARSNPTVYLYDADGNVLQATDPLGHITSLVSQFNAEILRAIAHSPWHSTINTLSHGECLLEKRTNASSASRSMPPHLPDPRKTFVRVGTKEAWLVLGLDLDEGFSPLPIFQGKE